MDRIDELTKSLSAAFVPFVTESFEDVTVVDTDSGLIVWCTFKYFLSVTFMFSNLLAVQLDHSLAAGDFCTLTASWYVQRVYPAWRSPIVDKDIEKWH